MHSFLIKMSPRLKLSEMERSPNQSSLFYLTTPLIIILFLCSSCGSNIFESIASKDSDKHYLEEAKTQLNAKEYEEAEKSLNKVKGQSNEKTLLLVGSKLGAAGLSLWELLLDIFDSTKKSNSSSIEDSGIENIFNSISNEVFGVGEEREKSLLALESSISLLTSAPDQDEGINSFRCFLTGIFVLPVVTDASSAILEVTSSLESLESNVVGSGNSRSECPGIESFETASSLISNINETMSYILEQTADCELLSFLEDGNLNEMTERLDNFVVGADKGCPSLDCSFGDTSCAALNRGCISEVLDTSSAISGDGKVDQCELIFNCRKSGSCF